MRRAHHAQHVVRCAAAVPYHQGLCQGWLSTHYAGSIMHAHMHAGAPGGGGFPDSGGGAGSGDSNDVNRWEKAAVPCIEHLKMLGLQPLCVLLLQTV